MAELTINIDDITAALRKRCQESFVGGSDTPAEEEDA